MQVVGKSKVGRIRSGRRQTGFTLVEMAIVLVVIGLILGAVMIGKDVQRNAEYVKVKQKFIDQWVVGYNTYDQRTGVVVGDNQTSPRLMVDGANFTSGAAQISGGDMSTVTPPGAICHGSAGPGMTRTMEAATGYDLRDLMQKAGVTMPPGRAEGSEDRYVYLDANGNPQEIQVCFQWDKPNDPAGVGNVMVITGLTPDLARYLDQSIDGKADARHGRFREQGIADNNSANAEWTLNDTAKYVKTGATNGTYADENQVATLVAIYKMNQ